MPFGGMDSANWALARWLARREDCELHLVAHRIDEELQRFPRVIFHKVPKPFGSNLLGFPLVASKGLKVSRRMVGRGGRTLVNGANCPYPDASWVHYLHAAHEPITPSNPIARAYSLLTHALYLRCERRWLPKSKLLFANSQRTKTDILHHYQIEPDRVHVVYYGNDEARFHPLAEDQRSKIRIELGLGLKPESKIAVFVGALGDRRKGFDILYEAWLDLARDASWDVRLLVVGAGRDLEYWRARSSQDGLASRISFLGFRKDVELLLGAADILVHAARYEAYGLAVQEALCCGVPAIVCEEAGVSERISGALRELILPTSFTARDIASRLVIWRSAVDCFRSEAAKVGQVLSQRGWDDMALEIGHRWLGF